MIVLIKFSDEFKKLNPMGYVPALVIDGHTLADSVSVESLHLGSGSLSRKPHEILMKGGGAIFHGLGSHPGGSRNTPSHD